MKPVRVAAALPAPITRPGDLGLVTGIVDDRRGLIDERHDHFALFAWVRTVQDDWPRDVHRGFWEAALHLWPLQRGPKPNAEVTASWVLAARRRGLDESEIAKRLGYSIPDVQRMGFSQLADVLAEPVVSDYWLPRVYGDGDEVPEQMAFPNLDATRLSVSAESYDARVAQLETALAALPDAPSTAQ